MGASDLQPTSRSMSGDAHDMAPARPRLRVLALNMCLLPAGINFSGSFLVDGDDRKVERIGMLSDLIDDFDIVLLNEASDATCHDMRRAGTPEGALCVGTLPVRCRGGLAGLAGLGDAGVRGAASHRTRHSEPGGAPAVAVWQSFV